MAVGYDVCMIHDLEGELYEYDFEGETAADDDKCKLLEAARRCCSKSMKTGGADSGCHMRCLDILEKTSS